MSEIISFGEWIKRRRKALDLTQGALAQRAHCSVELIRKIEGDARRPSREIAAGLADALDLTSNERLSFIQVARAELSADRLPRPVRPTARGAFVSADLQPIRLLTSKAVWPSGTITFLFTEITNSTLLWELHPQEMPAVMMRSVALLTNTVLAHGGVVFKTMDEHLWAAFAQAPDALTASHAAQQAVMTELWTLPVPLHMRMAIHSGTPMC
jgi:class 3 adenylate cyclase